MCARRLPALKASLGPCLKGFVWAAARAARPSPSVPMPGAAGRWRWWPGTWARPLTSPMWEVGVLPGPLPSPVRGAAPQHPLRSPWPPQTHQAGGCPQGAHPAPPGSTGIPGGARLQPPPPAPHVPLSLVQGWPTAPWGSPVLPHPAPAEPPARCGMPGVLHRGSPRWSPPGGGR